MFLIKNHLSPLKGLKFSMTYVLSGHSPKQDHTLRKGKALPHIRRRSRKLIPPVAPATTAISAPPT